MEYPLYFLSEKNFTVQKIQKGKEEYSAKVWTQGDYWFEAVAGIPNEYDYIILVYLLILSQRNNHSTIIEVSILDILKGCGIDPGSAWYYKRVRTSLEVWERTRFHFERQSFRYKKSTDQGGYEIKFKELHAGIVSNWAVIEGTTKLRIGLDDQFVAITQSSRFYKNIGFRDLKQLRGEPTAIRLHEILLKSFEAADTWEIGTKKLGTKLTIPDVYPSRIKAKVLAALDVINIKTSRQFTVEYFDKNSGCKLPKFRFQIIRKRTEPSQQKKKNSASQGNVFFQPQLPFGMNVYEEQREDITELINFFYEYIAKTVPNNYPADIKTEKRSSYNIIMDLNETDGYDMKFIIDVLVFCVSNPFWKNRFYTLTNLREISENGNTAFKNMANAFEGKRNPSSKQSTSKANKKNRQHQNAGAISSFLNNEEEE